MSRYVDGVFRAFMEEKLSRNHELAFVERILKIEKLTVEFW